MTSVNINLIYEGDGINEVSSFKWFKDNNKLEFISVEGIDVQFGTYSSLTDKSVTIDEEDFYMVQKYMEICGENLANLALSSGSTVVLKKEIWMIDLQAAIVETWLEKDGCTMMKTNVKVDYCNKILPLLSSLSTYSV